MIGLYRGCWVLVVLMFVRCAY